MQFEHHLPNLQQSPKQRGQTRGSIKLDHHELSPPSAALKEEHADEMTQMKQAYKRVKLKNFSS